MSKRKILNKLLSFPAKLFQRKIVIFYSAADFHSKHLIPVIEVLMQSKKIKIILLGDFGSENRFKVYKDHHELPLYLNYDVFISTDFSGVPYWINSKKIFFGHGVGPKINYQSSDELKAFDASFAPCLPFYNAHSVKIKNVYKVGLPILDNLTIDEIAIKMKLGIKSDAKILLYAPSWNSNPSLISNINKIISYLATSKNYELVISPHPLLFIPKRCGGLTFFNSNHEGILNKPKSGISTLELCKASSIVVSDISSILFEAIALQKKVFWDGNIKVYESCGALDALNLVRKTAIEIDYNQTLENNNNKEIQKNKLINDYIFNNGSAVNAFIHSLEKEIGIKIR